MTTATIRHILTVCISPFDVCVYYNGGEKTNLTSYFCRFSQVRRVLGGFGGHIRSIITTQQIQGGMSCTCICVDDLLNCSIVFGILRATIASWAIGSIKSESINFTGVITFVTTAHVILNSAGRSYRVSIYHNGECHNLLSNYYCKVSQIKKMITNHGHIGAEWKKTSSGSVATYMSVANMTRCGEFGAVIESISKYIAGLRRHETVNKLAEKTMRTMTGICNTAVGYSVLLPTGAAEDHKQPHVDEPSTDKPSVNEPSTDKPSPDKPSVDEPSTDKPSPDKPSTDKPSTDQSHTGLIGEGRKTSIDVALDELFAMKPEPQQRALAAVKGKQGVYVLQVERDQRTFFIYGRIDDLSNVLGVMKSLRDIQCRVCVVEAIPTTNAVMSASMIADMNSWVIQNNCGRFDEYWGYISLAAPQWGPNEVIMTRVSSNTQEVSNTQLHTAVLF